MIIKDVLNTKSLEFVTVVKFLTESNKSPTSSAESTKWWVWDLFVLGGVISST